MDKGRLNAFGSFQGVFALDAALCLRWPFLKREPLGSVPFGNKLLDRDCFAEGRARMRAVLTEGISIVNRLSNLLQSAV